MNALEISRTGLDVEWRRMEIIAQNIANMNTSRTASGDPFTPLRLVSGPDRTFAESLVEARREQAEMQPTGVRVYGVEREDGGVRRVYEPGHPHADPEGFVSYPDISHAREMTLMIETARAYEANLVAMSSARQMYSSALQLGRPA